MASEKIAWKILRIKSCGILCRGCATNKILIETFMDIYRHTLFTPLYATRGSFGPGNI